MNIIIVSNEPWGEIWFSKHHYAFELSKTHNIVFINPTKKWSFKNLFSNRISSEKISKNLTVVNYDNFLPSKFLVLNNNIVSKRLNRFLEKSINFRTDVYWTFDPMRLYNPNIFKSKFSLFHVVDKYYFTHPAEIRLHKNMNAFIVVSKDFVKQYTNYNQPILTIPHGLSDDEFSFHPEEFRVNYNNYILYVGVIDKRLDYAVIKQMLQKFPNEKFLFLGSKIKQENIDYLEIFEENKYQNLIYCEPVHAKKLKYYIHNAKCCIAPMKNVDGNLISHHKILQYLAQGKAVFSPVFSEYLQWNDLLYMNNEVDTLMVVLNKYLIEGESEQLQELRVQIAKSHKYNIHLEKIFNIIKW